MRIDIISIFPEIVKQPLNESILKKAQEKGLVEIYAHNLREYTDDKHKTTDASPFGGGGGMILKPKPIFKAVENIKQKNQKAKVILLTPQGKVFNQGIAKKLSKEPGLILICGRYEGVDERVRQHLVDSELSIGNYVLTGGEIPAMVVANATARLIPGVLPSKQVTEQDSFSLKDESGKELIEYPQYTKPREFRGHKVPSVLLSGDHQKIKDWRLKQAKQRTKKRQSILS